MTGAMSVRAGRGWAYAGAILGGAVSIAANVAHSYVPPVTAPVGWRPHTGAVVGAVFWPAALFVAVEIVARIAWPTGLRWAAVRFGGLLPVALVAAVVSYRHLAGLLAFYQEDQLTATIGPLAIDGLMVMATGALVATGRQQPMQRARLSVPVVGEAPARDTDAAARTGRPRRPPIGTPGKKRTGTRTDDELIAALAGVPRDSDGTVPVRRAAAALGTGPDRARRLLRTAGLLRTGTDATAGTTRSAVGRAVAPRPSPTADESGKEASS